MASPIHSLLESFYARFEPRGIALVGSSGFGASFGRPAASVLPWIERAEGFTQIHFEVEWLSIYSSCFGRGTVLVAQFDFHEEYPPPERPWIGFARLAARIQRWLDQPDAPDAPGAGLPILTPLPSGLRPRPRSAEASFERPALNDGD